MDPVQSLESIAQAALMRGNQLLEAGDRPGAAAKLAEAREYPTTRLAAHNLIELQKLAGNFGQMMGLNCQISEQDDIFRFFSGHPTSVNPLRDYLADGWRTLSELMLLLESVDRPLMRVGSVLEFASGHGRFTRHLVKAVGGNRVTVSDVVTDAVEFSRRTFGVGAFESSTRPENLKLPARFNLVFVLSLFSHLPRTTWGAWLTRLWDAVEPGGLLVFSTHGEEAARRQGAPLSADGYFFAPSSESTAIDAQEYGTAFTDAGFVRAHVAEFAVDAEVQLFAPVWFWNHQDAWVLHKR